MNHALIDGINFDPVVEGSTDTRLMPSSNRHSKGRKKVSTQMLEKDNREQTSKNVEDIHNLTNKMANTETSLDQINKKITGVLMELRRINEVDAKERLEVFQRKLLKSVWTEFMTPISRDFNVEMKVLRKLTEEAFNKNIDVSKVLLVHS
jgi:seryl-tRNA synthetase